MKKIPAKYAMVWLAMCGMVGATLGVKNISGLFFTPVAESFGVGRGAVSLTLTISNLLLALGDFLSPRLLTSGSFRRLSRVCVAVILGATLLMGSVPGIRSLYLLSGIRGLFSGLLGMVIGSVVVNNWFVQYNSLVTGVVFASGGIVSALLSPALSAVIESLGWRAGFRAEALAVLLLYAPLLFLPVAFCPEDLDLAPLGGRKASADVHTSAAEEGRFGLPLVELLVFITFANSVSTFTNHLPGVANDYALPAAVGAAMLSASMITNSAGKIAIGALAERHGVKYPAMAYAVAIMGGLWLLLTVRSAPAALVSGALAGLAFSHTTVIPSLVTKDVFGVEQYRRIFPLVTMVGTIANASAASLIGFLYDGTGSYRPSILILIGMLCGILLLLHTLYRCRSEKTSQP